MLRFYRAYLKLASEKEEPLRSKLATEARALMDKHRKIPRTNFGYIEFVLRQESNKLQMLKLSNVQGITRKS